MCGETYKDRLISLDLLPNTYWHEFLDIMFFFKAVNNIITVSNEVLPQPIIPSRLTRTSVDTNVLSFRPRKCKTLTYQRSFFIRVIRTYNSLPESLRQKDLSLVRFRTLLLDYYHNGDRLLCESASHASRASRASHASRASRASHASRASRASHASFASRASHASHASFASLSLFQLSQCFLLYVSF